MVGPGDVTYNKRRNFLGALSVVRKTAYHLYSIGYSAQKGSCSVKLLRKSKWHPQPDSGVGKWHIFPSPNDYLSIKTNTGCQVLISALPERPWRHSTEMEYAWYPTWNLVVATTILIWKRAWLIPDITLVRKSPSWTIFFNSISFSLISYNHSLDPYSRCRWSSNTDEPLLFITYELSQLNILDVEKKALTLKRSVRIDYTGSGKFLNCLLITFLTSNTWLDSNSFRKEQSSLFQESMRTSVNFFSWYLDSH